MYLFSRSARLAPGHTREATAWSVAITEKVNRISEVPFTLWATVMSPAVGTLTWTTLVEDLEVLSASEGKLLADDGYLTLVDQGATYAVPGALDDRLFQIVHADLDAAGESPELVAVVEAVAAPGAQALGVEVGVELAKLAKTVTGCRASFGVAVTGSYGGVGWISEYHSMAQLQQAQAAMASDSSFVELIDSRASQAYLPGVATQRIHRRVL